jgi:flavin reductase (DIM6/NTAB) family NADH-FMN oxidoreductase RutF
LDARRLREALGLFPTGITIVTAKSSSGGWIGITMNSFNAVSLDPPLILFSVARSSYCFEPLRTAQAYAVNVLREEQHLLAERFARAGADKWSGVAAHMSEHDCPVLDGVMAVFECVPYAQYDGADHIILVGRVVRLTFDGAGDALVYYRGRYRIVGEALPHLP